MICITYILRNQGKYIKKLLWMVSYIFQGSSTHEARDQRKILYIRQSELKYLSNFRKRNQTRLLFGVF